MTGHGATGVDGPDADRQDDDRWAGGRAHSRDDGLPRGSELAASGWLPALDRRAARALVAFGASGLVVAIAVGLAVLVVLGPLIAEAAAFDRQRSAAISALASASSALDSTAAAADGASISLADAESSLRDASAATGQLADAAAALAAFSGAFGDTASRSRALSDELSRTADAVARSGADSGTVASQIRSLAGKVEDLSASLGPGGSGVGGPLGSSGVVVLAVLVLALLAWLGVAAATCLWVGRRALRVADVVSPSGRGAPGPA